MTKRDRILLSVVVGVGLLAAFWFVGLAPKRRDAKALDAQLVTAQQRLQTAQASVGQAAAARRRYQSDYATVARLGQAVPADDGTATLLAQLQAAAHGARVDMRDFGLGDAASSSSNSTPAPSTGTSGTSSGSTGSTGSSPATQVAAASLPPGAAVGTAGFPTMPFKFVFTGSFADLQRLLTSMQDFVRVDSGAIDVRGRLLTVDGVSLIPNGFPQVKATIAATAFVLPANQATPAAAAAPTTSTTPSTTTSAIGVTP